MLFHLLFDPFMHHGFMCRAMIACCALSISTTLIGSFLFLRRMSLMGDALSHAILPGVVVGYFLDNTSMMIMGFGGIISGILVVIVSVWISSQTLLEEDASFSGFYLGSLSLGVLLMSLSDSKIDLLHILFGSIMLIDIACLNYIGVVVSITLIIFAVFYRAFVIEAFDSDFLTNVTNSWYSRFIQIFFLSLVVLNLVASFQLIGTLMSIGLMILPVLIARCWTTNLLKMLLFSILVSLFCSWSGLICSFYLSLPAGPIIILLANIMFFISVLLRKYN